ncbi:hypothetical protein DYGSA30_30020 [Dyella sp. GSA-30]|nr:hypothetical protein DYGSA30_30020 [Dyella sp. GSA-30]
MGKQEHMLLLVQAQQLRADKWADGEVERRTRFALRHDRAFGVRIACSGQIDVLPGHPGIGWHDLATRLAIAGKKHSTQALVPGQQRIERLP